ncbi:MAG: quinone-dependent dihydroorotate dehydrogenase [Bdellovibrionaceae bacterium]|nr:quinone-dependent dihydroorotate dehydrogenase [Pseudobdellovibrionaceae bacterium]
MTSESAFEKLLDYWKPWLWMSPSVGHDWLPFFLKMTVFLSEKSNQPYDWHSRKWRNLYFRNPVGIAGGLDKTGQSIDSWWNLGAGFLEIGTVTPHAQKPNSGKIMDRFKETEALWNRMGFPSPGYKSVLFELEKNFENRQTPIFLNIGKNRTTANENAHEDYTLLMRQMHQVCDVFVVNISSPNTTGLRQLFSKKYFEPLMDKLGGESRRLQKPLLLKLSPDEPRDQLESIIHRSYNQGVDGYVITNTTIQRPTPSPYPEDGGLSGKPLAAQSLQTLKDVVQILGLNRNNKLIVNAGGISSGTDLRDRLYWGADLCQIYSSLVFRGPYTFKKIAHEYQSTI